MLDLWGVGTCANIMQVIEENIISLSIQKYSSNVIEKCFDLLGITKRYQWIKEVFHQSKILYLIKNKYGNYVLQKALQIMTHSEKREIKESLNNNMNSFSKKDKSRLKEFLDVI